MAEAIKSFRTKTGDLPVDYESLANLPKINGQELKGDVNVEGGSGATFTPAVDSEGNLSWSNDGGLENPETVNIMGPQGDKGDDGYTPVKGEDYWTEEDQQSIVEAVLANFTDVSEVAS